MRIALLIAGSLLATACGGGQGEADRADQGTAIAQPDADAGGAFAAQAPSAQDFAQTAAMSDMFEIQSSRLALEKTKSGPAREFAQMMIADHTQSSEALKKAIADSGQSLAMPNALDDQHQAQIDALQRVNGEAFQQEYMTQQMAAHQKALDLLKSYAGGGDVAELRQFAQSTIPVIQKHYDWLQNNAPGTTPMREAPEANGGTPGMGNAAPNP